MKSLSLFNAILPAIAVLSPTVAAEQALSVSEMDRISAGGAFESGAATNPALAALAALGNSTSGATNSATSTRSSYGTTAAYLPGCNAAAVVAGLCGGGSIVSPAETTPSAVADTSSGPAYTSPAPTYVGSDLVSPSGNPEVFAIDFVHQRINNLR